MSYLDEPTPLFTPKARYDKWQSDEENLKRLSAIGNTCYRCNGLGCEECKPDDV